MSRISSGSILHTFKNDKGNGDAVKKGEFILRYAQTEDSGAFQWNDFRKVGTPKENINDLKREYNTLSPANTALFYFSDPKVKEYIERVKYSQETQNQIETKQLELDSLKGIRGNTQKS